MLPVLAQADVLDQGHLYKTGVGCGQCGQGRGGRPTAGDQTLQHQRLHPLAQALLAPEPRAWHSWREGNRLAFLGIATPTPLAVLEKRFFWLRSQNYLVTEYLPGPDIIERFAPMLSTATRLKTNCWRWTICSPS